MTARLTSAFTIMTLTDTVTVTKVVNLTGKSGDIKIELPGKEVVKTVSKRQIPPKFEAVLSVLTNMTKQLTQEQKWEYKTVVLKSAAPKPTIEDLMEVINDDNPDSKKEGQAKTKK